ncbi:MAG: nucleoside triphosphate pyrophosphohydrolase [Actinomycetota bacterium]|nr:nucleoside triphosphate pyrophosphohydrolase [Actinomycetota bacterium]
MTASTSEALARLDEITRRLRRECPWDREQDARSIVPHTVEESYELAEAAGRDDTAAMLDELGDVLFQVIFLALLLEERGEGDLAAVAESCSQKLIRRHPHVFGSESGGTSTAARPGAPGEMETAGEVLAQWEQIKREVEGRGDDPLAGIPGNLPALMYARKLLRRIDPEGSAGAEKPGGPQSDPATREAAERQVGELLLSAVRLSRELGVDPELALRAQAARLVED